MPAAPRYRHLDFTIDQPLALVKQDGDRTLVGFLSVSYDLDVDKPCTAESYAHIVVFRRGALSMDAAGALLATPGAVRLSRYAHGLVRYFVDGIDDAYIPDRRWDVAECAGVWLPSLDLRRRVRLTAAEKADGMTREMKLRRMAANDCVPFSSWCNGECFSYQFEAFEAKRDADGSLLTDAEDYRRETPVTDDSCGGYIGDDIHYGYEDATEGFARRA